MVRRTKVLMSALLAVGALSLPAVATGASTKTCTEEGTPHKNFTTTSTQTPACNSNSNVNETPQSVTNKGGNEPGGQQP
jgi:hypothetical protein